MQTPADPLDAAALAAAVEPGQDRRFAHLFEVDWDRDGTFSHALSDLSSVVTRSRLTQEQDDSTAGAEVLPSGAVASELEITLGGGIDVGGVPTPISEVLAPYNAASPLYGVPAARIPIRYSIITATSRGPISLGQLTGSIDHRGARRLGNEIVLICYDAAADLSDPVSWPMWGVHGPTAGLEGSTDPQRGLASSVVDHIANSAGLRTRPRPPWQSHSGIIALVWLPLCGGLAPSVGRMLSLHPWGNSNLLPDKYTVSPGVLASGEYWVEGPFGLARNAKPGWYPGSVHYITRDSLPLWSGRSTSLTAWIYCGPTAPGHDTSPSSALRPVVAALYFGYQTFSGNFWATRLSIASDGKDVQIQVEAGTDRHYRVGWTAPSNTWRHVHVELDHTAGPVRAKMFIDGVQVANFVPTGTGNSQVGTPLNVLFTPELGLRLGPCVRVCDVMAWQETGPPTVVPERTVHGGVRAVIDRSLNEITHLPAPSGSKWQALADLAAAEYAVVIVKSDGTLHWLNRETARATDMHHTLTPDSATDVGTADSAAGTANTVECSATPGEATWTTSYDLPTVDTMVVPVGTSTHLMPLPPEVCAPETGTVPRLYQSAESASTVPVWDDPIHGYVFVFNGGETEELLNQSMISTVDQSGLDDGATIRIVVNNTGSAGGRFRMKNDSASGSDPKPALRIAGLVVSTGDTHTAVEEFPAAIAAAGRRHVIALGGGPWHQHLPSVRATARYALRRGSQAIPTFDTVELLGDPRREVTDGCLLLFGDAATRVVTFLAGLTRTLDDNGLRDELLIRATHGPARWALGDPVLGQLGITATLG